MKNLLLFCILLVSISMSAQRNEVSLSYTLGKDELLNKSAALNYYRNFSNAFALGVKANFSGIGQGDYAQPYAGNIDLVSRWNISKKQNVRLFAEAGISKLRTYEAPMMWGIFCGTIAPGERFTYPHFSEDGEWTKTNYYGFVGRVGIDFRIVKGFFIGANYGVGMYRSNQQDIYQSDFNTSDLRINLGLKF